MINLSNGDAPMQLTKSEENQAIDAVRKAAKAEAEAAKAEGWRVPMRSNVARALGRRRLALEKDEAIVTNQVFAEVHRQQEDMIRAVIAELRTERAKLKLSTIAARLGIPSVVFYKKSVSGEARFQSVIDEELGVFKPCAAPQQEPVKPLVVVTRGCRCGCADRTDGKTLINGYLPGCWAEYQQWVAKDQRHSA